jgi:PAS domain S-box-containing protein
VLRCGRYLMERIRLPDDAMIMVDTVPAMVWVSDANALRTYFNRSWLEFTGRTLAQELGNGWTEGIHRDDLQRCLETYRSAVKAHRSFRMEYRLRGSDGRYRWLLSHGEPRFSDQGGLEGYVGSCLDISEQKAAEEALKEIQEQLDARVKERTSELDRAQERLRMLSARLLQMQDDERRRIARELHDTVGQMLVALNLNLVPVEEELEKINSGLAGKITESLHLIEELSRDLRTMSHLLHPPLLDEAGLLSAVRWYVEGFAERSKIQVDLKLDPNIGRLPAELETAIFRIVQECLTNIHRHSGSSSASIVITRDTHNVRIEIRDRGKGMPTPIPRAGVGIQGMGERARQLGGHLEVESGNGGTRIAASFPANSASEVSEETLDMSSRRSG